METKKLFFILFLLLPLSPSPFSSEVQLLVISQVHALTFSKANTENPTGVNTFPEEWSHYILKWCILTNTDVKHWGTPLPLWQVEMVVLKFILV